MPEDAMPLAARKVSKDADPLEFLKPSPLINSDHPEIVAYARAAIGDAEGEVEKALRLYYAIRDDIRYDAYRMGRTEYFYDAATCLADRRGFCVPKAALLAACARAVGLPARVGYGDVRNHLASPQLLELLGTDLFIWHSFAEIWLPHPDTGEYRWVKATPAFNLALCEKFKVKPLEWDGVTDSLFHEQDLAGNKHMEYVHFRESYDGVPWQEIARDMDELYPRLFATAEAGETGDLHEQARPME